MSQLLSYFVSDSQKKITIRGIIGDGEVLRHPEKKIHKPAIMLQCLGLPVSVGGGGKTKVKSVPSHTVLFVLRILSISCLSRGVKRESFV